MKSDRGYAMAALLVGMSIMAVTMAVALPVWNTIARREKEAELVFRGEQYARAIGLFQRKYANTLPPNLEVLINERFLRKKYQDPITGKDFQLLSGASGQTTPGGAAPGGAAPGGQGRTGGTGMGTAAGAGSTGIGQGTFSLSSSQARGSGAAAGGIMGVTSQSKDKSLRLYNGRGVYNEWAFVPVVRNTAAGGPGAQTPDGATGRGSGPPGGGRGRGISPDGIGPGGQRGTGGGLTPPFGGIRRP